MRIICRCILHNYFITGIYTDVSRYLGWVVANADFSGSSSTMVPTTKPPSTTTIRNTDFICRADGNYPSAPCSTTFYTCSNGIRYSFVISLLLFHKYISNFFKNVKIYSIMWFSFGSDLGVSC